LPWFTGWKPVPRFLNHRYNDFENAGRLRRGASPSSQFISHRAGRNLPIQFANLGASAPRRLNVRMCPKTFAASGAPARHFAEFVYQTRKSWSRARRVIGKAEWLEKGANPRFIVTSLAAVQGRELYERTYCARGEMENRIKEQQLDLFADRTSTGTMRANQLRLFLASLAYVLLNELRRVGLAGTELARAQMGTIRLKLLKVGALVKLSVRRVLVSISRAFPYRALYGVILENLRRAYPLRA
jgi:hypothetical protein